MRVEITMRFIEEYKTTTNNFVFNRVRIPYDSNCGYCGVSSGCNKRRKHKFYEVGRRYKKKFNEELGYRVRTDEYELKGRYPNWKMVSKNKKQWMEKSTYLKPIVYHVSWMQERYPEKNEIKW